MIVVYDIIVFTFSWKATICMFIYSNYLQCQKATNHHYSLFILDLHFLKSAKQEE